jgi:CubicO group peptidase (beta-lactamase class C family)
MIGTVGRRLAWIFCFWAVLYSGVSAAPIHELTAEQMTAIDRYVAAEMRREHVPGIAVGIYSRGQILLAKGYGLANIELNVPVKAETIFQSGSVGKQFTSAAIMMLVEEGKLGLDDSIVKYFPNAPQSWQAIRVKNLLSHTSGLSEYESNDRVGPEGPFYIRLDFTEDELVNKIEALPIEFKPGDKWDYRNTNYVLLGVIIHKVTASRGFLLLLIRLRMARCILTFWIWRSGMRRFTTRRYSSNLALTEAGRCFHLMMANRIARTTASPGKSPV